MTATLAGQDGVGQRYAMSILSVAESIGSVMRAIPAPTSNWAAIIDSLAWPGLIGFLVVRYRSFLRMFLLTLTDRLKTDHIKLGPLELTPGSDVLVLDSEEAAASTAELTGDDVERIERLFEFASEADGFNSLCRWVSANVDPILPLDEFLTQPRYAIERESAYRTLIVQDADNG